MKIFVNKNEDNIDNIKDNIKISNIITINSNCENIVGLKNGILLDNIKSTFFSRMLFSHLDEKFKLKIIKK